VRGEGDRYAAIRSSVVRILSESASFTEAASKILQTACQDLGWDVACVWRLDESATLLRFVLSWHPPDTPESELEKMSARVAFSPGVGLPGRVLSTREPAWIRDVQTDLSFPRGPAAAVEGIRGAFACPIGTGKGFLGVMEFFSLEVRERDEELLRVMATIGEQLGPLISGEPRTDPR
jgi:GAF domain-containing protein